MLKFWVFHSSFTQGHGVLKHFPRTPAPRHRSGSEPQWGPLPAVQAQGTVACLCVSVSSSVKWDVNLDLQFL